VKFSELRKAHLEKMGYTPLTFLFTMAQQPQWTKASSLSKIQLDTPHSVGLLWTSDKLCTIHYAVKSMLHSSKTDTLKTIYFNYFHSIIEYGTILAGNVP
jgi:hypothetical protein